uniref:SLIT-ROBO Rho GTPase-activating protein 3-like n=1 Tax=Cyprinus carpio TaxID=7962 RepID=A0A8C1RWU1_CYPCA
MTSHGKLRKEKGSLAEYETQIKEVRGQLSEQLKILDAQVEVKTQQLQDLSEYLRRRGEIEAEYARSLEKLSERFTVKTKRKEQLELSVAQCWSVLLTQTRQESRDHSSLSELCCNTLTQRLSHCIEDTHRLAKRSKEVGLQMQDELLKVTTELQTVCEVSAEGQVRFELETRFQQLQSRLASVTLETEEVKSTLKTTLSNLLESICDDDCNPTPDASTTPSVESTGDGTGTKPTLAKRRANQQDTETFYFTKVKEHISGSSLISKLQAKHDLLKEAIQKVPVYIFPRTQPGRSVRVRKARPCSQYHHKLFSGDMLSFIQSSGQQIPLVVESCIRFINLHGLHHEGIFRVPGSQTEVNHIRDAFERGEDPLTDSESDIDSVAGVLKLYFRGLEKPLFPEESFSQLMELAQIKTVVSSFPRPVIIVMRYLFAFLHHVSQYSDENMMQPYNLAVCFGPSLLRGSEMDGDEVTLAPQINDLVKTMIIHHENIVPGPSELPGPIYEKCMTLEQEYCEPIMEEGEGDAEHPPSEDEWDAVAMFDYVARSAAELSFKQGDHLLLQSKVSADWWRGEAGGVKGLIPHKYISVAEG